jgi:outer membrane lipopolysaccharide assembly protein LptE/RlpB
MVSPRLLWFAALLMVQACGFAPRGSITELSDPGSIYIDTSRDSSLTADLEKALTDRAFRIAPNRDAADIWLRLTGERQVQRIVSLQSTGRVSEFELSHSVNMLVAQSKSGEDIKYDPVQSSNLVEVIREYTYDTTGVLGKENEARTLRGEMREELIRQIVLRAIARLGASVSS